jgi:hypothetical protein
MRGREKEPLDPSHRLQERAALFGEIAGSLEHKSGWRANASVGGLIGYLAFTLFAVWLLRADTLQWAAVLVCFTAVALQRARESSKNSNAQNPHRRAQGPPEP